jgi:hypothetical protein
MCAQTMPKGPSKSYGGPRRRRLLLVWALIAIVIAMLGWKSHAASPADPGPTERYCYSWDAQNAQDGQINPQTDNPFRCSTR